MDSLVDDFIEHDSVMEMESHQNKVRRISKIDDQCITFDKSEFLKIQFNESQEKYESVFAESRLATEMTQRSIRISTFGDEPDLNFERSVDKITANDLVKSEVYKAPNQKQVQATAKITQKD